MHKIDKIIHIQAQMQLSKEEYARKRIHNGWSVRIENFVSQDNCSASLFGITRHASRCPKVTLMTEFSIRTWDLTAIKDSYNKGTYENV